MAQGLTISSAALLAGKGSRVVHCGTSDRNLFTIDRASELTTLSHRTHYRAHGKTTLERVVLSRWDNVVVSPDYFLSAERLARLSQKGVKFLRTFSKNGFRPIELLEKTERKLTHIDKIVKLFQPFIHDYHYVFTGDALKNLSLKEVEFEFAPEKLDWRRYWLDIQMPGLRKWCFPTIEGQKVETDHATNPVRFVKTENLNKKREISTPALETRGMA